MTYGITTSYCQTITRLVIWPIQIAVLVEYLVLQMSEKHGSGFAESFKGRLLLLVFDKAVLGFVVAVVILLGQLYILRVQNQYQENRERIQLEMEHVRLTSDVINQISSADLNMRGRATALHMALNLNIIDKLQAAEILVQLLQEGLGGQTFIDVARDTMPDGLLVYLYLLGASVSGPDSYAVFTQGNSYQQQIAVREAGASYNTDITYNQYLSPGQEETLYRLAHSLGLAINYFFATELDALRCSDVLDAREALTISNCPYFHMNDSFLNIGYSLWFYEFLLFDGYKPRTFRNVESWPLREFQRSGVYDVEFAYLLFDVIIRGNSGSRAQLIELARAWSFDELGQERRSLNWLSRYFETMDARIDHYPIISDGVRQAFNPQATVLLFEFAISDQDSLEIDQPADLEADMIFALELSLRLFIEDTGTSTPSQLLGTVQEPFFDYLAGVFEMAQAASVREVNTEPDTLRSRARRLAWLVSYGTCLDPERVDTMFTMLETDAAGQLGEILELGFGRIPYYADADGNPISEINMESTVPSCPFDWVRI